MLTVLCGGYGAARLLPGLAAASGDDLCCVVNTGDDLDYLGLHVSPDVDSVCYALAGVFDEERGWGVVGDTFRCNAALACYGDDWFHVGDADLALHLKRTALMRRGLTLSAATETITSAWRLRTRVLPMTDATVRTVLDTDEGRLGFQEYLVRRAARPTVREVSYEGNETATPAPGVLSALRDADIVVLAPSNPVSSIGPILALGGVREALVDRTKPTVAVTPVVRGRRPTSPPARQRACVRAKLLAACGLGHCSTAVATLYRNLVHGFVLDVSDASERGDITRLGMAVHVADTLAGPPAARKALASEVLRFARGLGCPASGWRRDPG